MLSKTNVRTHLKLIQEGFIAKECEFWLSHPSKGLWWRPVGNTEIQKNNLRGQGGLNLTWKVDQKCFSFEF